MKSPNDIVVGLDIGTSKCSAIICQVQADTGIQVLGVGNASSSGLRRGAVVNIEITLESLGKAINDAEMMAGFEIRNIFSGIAGGHIEGINSRGVVAVAGKNREITTDDINRVIEAARAMAIPMDREVLHVLPQEYRVDDQHGIKNPLDMIGFRLEAAVHIITSSRTAMQNLMKCINRAGFHVEQFVLQSLASAYAVLSADDMDMGMLVIDMGGGTTDVILFYDSAPHHTSVLAIGGDRITHDISQIMRLPYDISEQLKVETGCCHMSLIDPDEIIVLPKSGARPEMEIRRQAVCQAIQDRVAEIFELVKKDLDDKNILPKATGGLVLTGGCAVMPGMCELAQDIFQLPARIGYPNVTGGMSSEVQSPLFATAVGLAKYALSSGYLDMTQESNRGENSNSSILKKILNWFRNF